MPTQSGASSAIPLVLGLCATPSSDQTRPASCDYRRIDWNWWTNQSVGPPAGTKPGGWDTLTDTSGQTTVRNAHNAGKKLILTAAYTPPWAGGNGSNGHNFPTHGEDWANAMYVAAAKYETLYPGTVIAWTFGNEPQNGFCNDNTTGKPNVTLYGTDMEMAYVLFRTGVLNGRPNRPPLPTTVQFWSGGTGAGPSVGSQWRHLNWNRSLLQRPVRCLDGVNVHMYSAGCPLGTHNGYDPAINDIPGIWQAIHDSSWASAANPIIQIHCDEAGYFHRDDTTPTASDCGDNCNCNSYGKGPNANEKIEVTVSTAATRMGQAWTTWKSLAAFGVPCGVFMYFQQDTVSPNNTATTSGGGALAAFDHAGLYTYAANRNGTPTLDHLGNPALVNAFAALQTAAIPPKLTSLSPLTGTTAGGTTVTIVGTNLQNVTSVNFGANSVAPASTATDGTSLTATTPAHTNPKTVQVTAVNADGTSNKITYQYLVPAGGAPTVTSVIPNSGPIAGGSSYALVGTGFSTVDTSNPANVMFGVDAAASIAVTNDTHMTAVAPSPLSAAGKMDVTVANASGTSTASTADQIMIVSQPPTFTIVAISLADGTVYQDFSSPVTVSGTIGVAWSAVDDDGIQSSWLETGAGVFLAPGVPAMGLYGATYDTTLQSDGDLAIRPNGVDVDNNPPATLNPVTINVSNASQAGVGLFAKAFRTDYTDGTISTSPPTVGIESAVPNPLP